MTAIPPSPPASSAGRSRNMQAIRRTDTKPEIALRRRLHAAGCRYRKDFRLDLRGGRVRPDIVFTRRHVAVFLDSCFWHVCPEHGRQPTKNESYWVPKLRRNVQRDRMADSLLTEAGWTVIRVWEHEPLDDAQQIASSILWTTLPPELTEEYRSRQAQAGFFDAVTRFFGPDNERDDRADATKRNRRPRDIHPGAAGRTRRRYQ